MIITKNSLNPTHRRLNCFVMFITENGLEPPQFPVWVRPWSRARWLLTDKLNWSLVQSAFIRSAAAVQSHQSFAIR